MGFTHKRERSNHTLDGEYLPLSKGDWALIIFIIVFVIVVFLG